MKSNDKEIREQDLCWDVYNVKEAYLWFTQPAKKCLCNFCRFKRGP